MQKSAANMGSEEDTEQMNKQVVDHIKKIFNSIGDGSVRMPDDSRPITETLKLIEQELLHIVEVNEEMYKKNPIKYDLIFKQVRNRRKKIRNDRSQPLAIAEMEAAARKNQRDVSKKDDVVVFKGKPLAFKARKKRIVKR